MLRTTARLCQRGWRTSSEYVPWTRNTTEAAFMVADNLAELGKQSAEQTETLCKILDGIHQELKKLNQNSDGKN